MILVIQVQGNVSLINLVIVTIRVMCTEYIMEICSYIEQQNYQIDSKVLNSPMISYLLSI